MIVVDTCVVSAWLGRDASTRRPRLVRFVDELVEEGGLSLSSVSAWELRRWMLGSRLVKPQNGQKRSPQLRPAVFRE
jgi:hypothetical protein